MPAMTSGTDDTLEGSRSGAARAPAPSIVGGGKVGRYVVIDRLAAGGMGVVYAAYDPELDRKIALKLLHPARAPTQTESEVRANLLHVLFGDDQPTPVPDLEQGRLLREAQAAARINHPNVVTVHDAGEHAGAVFIAMEYVDGSTLGAWLREQPRSLAAIVDVMYQAGCGLASAHASGLVHRDFKPDNVMIDRLGRARVMDFGLVRSDEATEDVGDLRPTRDALGMTLTRAGALMGTPAYMSPEQYLGHPVSQASDQFSFCVTLWEALNGERPFRATSMQALAIAVTTGAREPVRSDARVPAHLRRLLDRGLQLDPAARYPSMQELLVELRRNPARTRRWIAMGVGVLALGGAALSVQALDVRATRLRCRADGDTIASVWNEDASTAMEEAMLATGLPFSATAVAKTRPWLDAYAQDWATARREACEAQAFHDDALAVQTLECLDDRAAELENIVAKHTHATSKTVRSAVTDASELTPITDCSDRRRLEQRERPPDDPVQAEAARALKQRHTIAIAQHVRGEVEGALATLEGASDEAVALGMPVLAGRIGYLEGALLEEKAAYPEAERVLGDAALELTRAGADEHAADAAIRVALVVAVRQSRHAEGELWGRWAETLLERAGEGSGRRAAELHNHLGLIADARGDFDGALREHMLALELGERLDAEHARVGTYLNNVGSVHSKLGHGDEAIGFYERALAIAESALGRDHPDNALPLNNIAKIHWQRGELAAARTAMERSLAIQEAALGTDHPQVGVSLGNLAIIVRDLGDRDGALQLLQRALTILRARLPADHPQIGRAYTNLGDTQRQLGDLEAARASYDRALAIYEKSVGPEHVELAAALGGSAMVLHDQGRFTEAIASFERAAAIYEKTVGKQHQDYATLLLELGRTLLAAGKPAVDPLERAMAVLDESRAGADARGRVRFHLARALVESGGDRRRAVELAREGETLLETAERPDAETLAQLKAWLREHPEPPR